MPASSSYQHRIHKHLTAQTDCWFMASRLLQLAKHFIILLNGTVFLKQYKSHQFTVSPQSPPPIPCSKHGDSILLSGDGNLSIHPGNLTGTRPSAEWQMNYGMPRGQQGWRHLPTPQHLALCPCTTARLQHVRCACAEMGHELCTSEGAPDF